MTGYCPAMSQSGSQALERRVAALEHKNVDLEVQISYQDKLIVELDTVLREFSRRVECLESELSQAREALEGMREAGPANDPPPHY